MNLGDPTRTLLSFLTILVVSGCCFFGGSNLEEYSIRAKNSSRIDGVKLELQIAGTVFQQDEDIEAELRFINQRSVSVTINARFKTALKGHFSTLREIYFEVYRDGEDAQTIFYTLHDMNPATKEHFVTLKPGEVHTVRTCIMRPIPLPFEKGHYVAYAIYENYFGPEFGFPQALMGTVKSNAVEFTVE
jgi:hypothetical protein